MDINKFIIRINKQKVFRELPEQYKSTKFCKLYYRIYSYMLSIPKEKLDIVDLVRYINFFLKAKDFYNWKERIYSLVTEKLSAVSKRKYELLYNSKAKEFFDKTQKQTKTTSMKIYGVEHPSQSKEVQDKMKATCLERYGEEHPMKSKEVQDKMKTTCLEIYGYENPSQFKEIKEKISNSHRNRSKEEINKSNEKRKVTTLREYRVENVSQSKKIIEKIKEKYNNKTQKEKDQIQEKRKATCLKIYGKENPLQSKEIQEKIITTKLELYGNIYGPNQTGDHSKIGDEICQAIDNALGNPEDSKYATKNGEFYLKTVNNTIRKYDYCIPSKKLIVEVDDPYWHALDKDDDNIIKFPGNKLVLAKEIHERDQEKEKLAISKGYKVYRIRDDEYKKDPKDTIEKLIKQIRKEIKDAS